jgi:hypothetical protein
MQDPRAEGEHNMLSIALEAVELGKKASPHSEFNFEYCKAFFQHADTHYAEIAAGYVRAEEALRAITNNYPWRHIQADSHNCHVAILVCEEMDDIARAALTKENPDG